MFRRLLSRINIVALFSTLLILALPSPSVSASQIETEKAFLVYEIQTASRTSASSEFISIVNASTKPQRLDGVCLHYSAATSDSWLQRACFNDMDEYTQLWVVSGGVVYVATDVFIGENPAFVRDLGISAGMAASGGAVKLTRYTEDLDIVGWGSSNFFEKVATQTPTNSELLSRNNLQNIVQDTDDNSVDFSLSGQGITASSGLFEVDIPKDICGNIAGLQTEIPEGYELVADDCLVDLCLNIEGLQETTAGFEVDSEGFCNLVELEDAVIIITELLPNVTGADDGKEFIELNNPNGFTVNLEGYTLVLDTKSYVFPDISLKSGEYLAVYDSDTGLVLPNTTGVEVTLFAQNGDEVSRSKEYSNAPDDQSWILISGQWQFTNQPTPGSANKVSLSSSVGGENQDNELNECPEGKFRNPLTNRCKNIESSTNSLVPCNTDEYRNPATNRCNKLSSSTSSLKPCAPNQERNPETNRCRAISSSNELEPCPEGKERNPETNRCRNVAVLASADVDGSGPALTATIVDVPAPNTGINWAIIGVAIFGSLAYIIYEWRVEISRAVASIRSYRYN